jgi:hypothetical protein
LFLSHTDLAKELNIKAGCMLFFLVRPLALPLNRIRWFLDGSENVHIDIPILLEGSEDTTAFRPITDQRCLEEIK